MATTAMAQKPKFSVMINSDGYQKMINSTIKDEGRRNRYVSSIVSAVATNPTLQECDPASILSGSLLGESLNLSPSPQLGHYFLVPYNDTKRGCKIAQFQMGYKGYIQLALRSGYYKRLNVIAVKKGELVKFDRLTEEIELNQIEDESERENAETIGYCALFEYSNGFRKTIYWTKQKMENHALRYSKGYKAKKGYTFWEKDFDAMAFKTMLRQLISKWGVMSTELQTAYEKDSVSESEMDEFFESEESELTSALAQANSGYTPDETTGEVVESAKEEPSKQVNLSDL